MYINDLNSACLYEQERRADEMRAARNSHLLEPAVNNRYRYFPALVVLVLFILVWIIL